MNSMLEPILWILIVACVGFGIIVFMSALTDRERGSMILSIFVMVIGIAMLWWNIEANICLDKNGYPIEADGVYDLLSLQLPKGGTMQYARIFPADETKDGRLKNITALFGRSFPEGCKVRRIVYDRYKYVYGILLIDFRKKNNIAAKYIVKFPNNTQPDAEVDVNAKTNQLDEIEY